MAATIVHVRFPAALLALLDAEVERVGGSRSQVILDAVGARLGGADSEAPRPPPKTKAPPRAPVARVEASTAERLAQARAATPAVQTAGQMNGQAAGIKAVLANVGRHDGGKRPTYQRSGKPGAGKARSGR